MPSPFPGMNPYLEQASVWRDFHGRFIPRLAEELRPQIRGRYFVRIEEHVYLHDVSEERRQLLGIADVGVKESGASRTGGAAGATVSAPLEVELPDIVTERLRYLTVRDRDLRRLVAIIEVLSPANKEGDYVEEYRRKRLAILQSPVHFVEIDLLRAGGRMPGAVCTSAYCALVSRVERRPKAELWPIGLRDRLPPLPIPLRTGEPDVLVDLQQALHAGYDGAGYEEEIYETTPLPPLEAEDAAWAAQFLPRRPLNGQGG